MVARTDKARIVGSIRRMDDGSLRGNAVVARSGILVYHENGKEIRELVRPETVSKADSLESLKMRPITNDHPSAKLVTPQNVKQFQVGFTGETVNSDGEVVYSSVVINDQGAISAVNSGKRELSCGYTCDLLDGAGVWNGERYDREQVNRKYNHVAICDLGRAGAIASLHLDAAEYAKQIAVLHFDAEDVYEVSGPEIDDNSHFQRSRPMPVTIKIDGLEYKDQAPEVAKHIEKLDAQIATLTASGKETQTKLDAANAEITALKDRIVKKDAEIQAMPGKVVSAAKARTDLVNEVKPHLDEETVKKLDSMSEDDIKRSVISKALPTATAAVEKADSATIQVYFDAAKSVLAASKERFDAAAAFNRQQVNGQQENRNDGCKGPRTKEQHEDSVRNAYKATNRDSIMK